MQGSARIDCDAAARSRVETHGASFCRVASAKPSSVHGRLIMIGPNCHSILPYVLTPLRRCGLSTGVHYQTHTTPSTVLRDFQLSAQTGLLPAQGPEGHHRIPARGPPVGGIVNSSRAIGCRRVVAVHVSGRGTNGRSPRHAFSTALGRSNGLAETSGCVKARSAPHAHKLFSPGSPGNEPLRSKLG